MTTDTSYSHPQGARRGVGTMETTTRTQHTPGRTCPICSWRASGPTWEHVDARLNMHMHDKHNVNGYNSSKLPSSLVNTASMLAMQKVHHAAVHHYTAKSAGDAPDCDHRHYTHHIRECTVYLNALEELMIECFQQGADYK